MERLKLTIKTFYGLEGVLKDELEELGYSGIEELNRAVQLSGTWRDVYFLNVHLRCAISVLVELKTFKIKTEKDLFSIAEKIKWEELFDGNKNFAVKGAIHSDIFRHSQYPFLLLKDAIVDRFRAKTGERPDVNVKNPQVLFDLYIHNQDVTISLNSSGVPLFQRGYRESTGEAPLNEVVAAGLLRLSGWDRKTDLIDPFCGSGTIAIEAALMATGLPANLERHHYAFKNFKNYKEEEFNEIIEAVNRRITSLPCRIFASDSSAEMVTKTRRNLRGLPIGRFVETAVCSFDEVKRGENPGFILTNPPYGERMGDDIEELYDSIGTWLKHEMTGYTCWIISSNMDAMKRIGLKPDQKIRVFNGKLECTFRSYTVFEGKRAKMLEQGESEQ
jgi:putative N6-adenine-specific DNA methylase